MVDRHEKLEDILSDYYNTIGKFNNVTSLIKDKSYEIKDTDDEDTKRIKEGQQREILVDLGRIAEMAFKYLIKLRRMELFPNESYLDTVDNNGNTVRGFKDKETLKAGVIREIGNKVHASTSDIDSILNVSGIGPISHNFNFLYLLIDKLMPDVRDKFNQITSLNIKSEIARKVLEEEKYHFDLEFIAFPNTDLTSDKEHSEKEKRAIEKINKRNSMISSSGDIFTRLRYYANNPFDKNFNIDEVYEMVEDIIFFIKIVHMSNENLNLNTDIAFSYYILKNNPNLSKFNIDEINQLYSHKKIKDNVYHLLDCIYFSNDLTINEVLEIINRDDISEDDYTVIFANTLNLEQILYLRSIGITNYSDMVYEVRKKQGSSSNFMGILLNEKYTLDEYKHIRERLEADKYPGIMNLLDHMEIESVERLKEYPEVLRFLIDEFYMNVNKVSYQYKDEIFKTLLSIEEVRENPNAWYGLDLEQLKIYCNISNVLLNDYKNVDIVNIFFADSNLIVENIKGNIREFKDDQKLLCVLPLMLDYEDNKHILEILIRNGLDINDLRGFDSTIFCLPVKLVEVIELLFKKLHVPLIVNNNVNPEVVDILDVIQTNMKIKGDYLKKRRIPFNCTLVRSEHKNEVVDELTYYYEKDCEENNGIGEVGKSLIVELVNYFNNKNGIVNGILDSETKKR